MACYKKIERINNAEKKRRSYHIVILYFLLNDSFGSFSENGMHFEYVKKNIFFCSCFDTLTIRFLLIASIIKNPACALCTHTKSFGGQVKST